MFCTHTYTHTHSYISLYAKDFASKILNHRSVKKESCLCTSMWKRDNLKNPRILRWPPERVSKVTDTSPNANNGRWRSIVRAIIKFLPRCSVSSPASIHAPRKSIKIIVVHWTRRQKEFQSRKFINISNSLLLSDIYQFHRVIPIEQAA